jgi:hypothetical protein
MSREQATIRTILYESNFEYASDIMDELITATADTLLTSKEGIGTKLDAISLLICISIKYPADYLRNKEIYDKLVEEEENIKSAICMFISTNVDSVSLDIALQFLYLCNGIDVYGRLLELMPYIKGDVATSISVARVITEYLELSDDVILPFKVESIVLQNALQWVHSDNLDVRWYAVRILFMLLRNIENQGIINKQILNIVDTDNVYIKNLLQKNIYTTKNVLNDTRQYVLSKCKNDANYVVRKVYKEQVEMYMDVC